MSLRVLVGVKRVIDYAVKVYILAQMCIFNSVILSYNVLLNFALLSYLTCFWGVQLNISLYYRPPWLDHVDQVMAVTMLRL